MPNLWQTVCGKIDPGESAEKACIRETLEETGIKIPQYRLEYIFNDEVFNCNVYITKLFINEIPKRTEPEKMSKWIPVSQEKYKHLVQFKVMTDDILHHI